MNNFFFSTPIKNEKDEADKHIEIMDEEHLLNISEGGEFLDDGIRMKEQPLMFTRTEESIAAGSIENLL